MNVDLTVAFDDKIMTGHGEGCCVKVQLDAAEFLLMKISWSLSYSTPVDDKLFLQKSQNVFYAYQTHAKLIIA